MVEIGGSAMSFPVNNERGILQSSEWTMSVEAEKSGEYEDLMKLSRDAYYNSSAISHTFSGYVNSENESDARRWDGLGAELFKDSQIFAESNDRDRIDMVRAWGDDFDWVYSWRRRTDGLWALQDVPEQRFVPNDMSRFVLSGMLGGKLLANEALSQYVERRAGTPLDKAILVGGAALSAIDRERVVYQGAPNGGMIPETWKSANVHGDFRGGRYMRPLMGVTTTLRSGRMHDFMPKVEEELIFGGHSIELAVLESLLAHQMKQRVHPEVLYEDITTGLGLGSDFMAAIESNDGAPPTISYHGLARTQQPETWAWGERLILSESPDLLIEPQNDGVVFTNTYSNGEGDKVLKIPNNEVTDYIISLMKGHGRTRLDTMVRAVYEGLIKPVDQELLDYLAGE